MDRTIHQVEEETPDPGFSTKARLEATQDPDTGRIRLVSGWMDGDYLDGQTRMGVSLTPPQARALGQALLRWTTPGP